MKTFPDGIALTKVFKTIREIDSSPRVLVLCNCMHYSLMPNIGHPQQFYEKYYLYHHNLFLQIKKQRL